MKPTTTIFIVFVWAMVTCPLFADVPYVHCDEYYASSFEYTPPVGEPIGPYWECTFKRPAYISPAIQGGKNCAECWWSAAGYDGSRLDRGMEACSGNSTTELRFTEDGWYGLNILFPSDYPSDKNNIVLQLFAHGRGGSWAGTLIMQNNQLSIEHRDWLTQNHTVGVLDANVPRDIWIPIIIYWKPSLDPNNGKVMVWYDGAPKDAPSYDYTGKFAFDDNDGWIGTDTMVNGIGLKWGQYAADAANYTPNEVRRIFYDDVSQLKGNPYGAWDLVNPEGHGRVGRIDAEYTSEESGTSTQPTTDVHGGLNLASINDGDWAAYYDVNFGTGASFFQARVASATSGGDIEVRLDSPTGPLLGTCPVGNTGGWQSWEDKVVPITPQTGLQKIFLTFTGGGGSLLNVNHFKFTTTDHIRIEAECYNDELGTQIEDTGDALGGEENLAFISNDDWARYDNVTLGAGAVMSFRVARPAGRPDSKIDVRLGSPTGTLVGSVAVPVTGGWQTYQTIQTVLAPVTGTHDLYLVFEETGSSVGNSLLNLNWFEFYVPGAPVDLTPPVITLVGGSTINLPAGSAYSEPGFSATDNFDGDLTGSVVVNNPIPSPTVPGTYTITYDVTDSSGNAAVQETRTVVVTDNTPPVIVLVGGPVSLPAGSAYVEPGFSATDNIDGTITSAVVVNNPIPSPTVPGTYTITYDVTDSSGNAAVQETRTVVVTDAVPPVIVLVGGPVSLPAGSAYVEPGFSATDNIDGTITSAVVVNNPVPSPTVPGTYTITYDVSDAAGNAAVQAVRSVVVTDSAAPVITLTGGPATLLLGQSYTEPGFTATDESDGDLSSFVTVSPALPALPAIGSYTLTYQVTDAAGNVGTNTRSVVVVDGDADGDGIDSSWEMLYGMDPTSPVGRDGGTDDNDGDGFNNLDEFTADTDPTDAKVYLRIVFIEADGDADIFFPASANRVYTLEYCLDLSGTQVWTPVAGQVDMPGSPAPNGQMMGLDSSAAPAGSFYRVRVSRP